MMSQLLWKVIWLLTGVSRAEAAQQCPASRRRTISYAFGILLPMLVWGVSGYLLASSLIHLSTGPSLGVAALCAATVYLIERLIQLSSGRWYVVLGRAMLAFNMALLCAGLVDSVAYGPEIRTMVVQEAQTRLRTAFERDEARLEAQVEVRRKEWLDAEAAAACEADRHCGSGRGGTGPIYAAKKAHASDMRRDYETERTKLETLKANDAQAVAAAAGLPAVQDPGLLAGLEALHRFLQGRPWAMAGWALIFVFVAAMELVVLLVKASFGMTLDDTREAINQQIRQRRMRAYADAVAPPVAPVARSAAPMLH